LNKLIIVVIQIFLLLAINQIGYLFVEWTGLPIPGNVVGMLMLFFLLWTGVIKLHWVEKASTILIKHLAFFFIPISVGLMTLGSLFLENGLILLVILMISGIVGIVTTGAISQTMINRKERVKVESHHHSV
jgi:holin-like protein